MKSFNSKDQIQEGEGDWKNDAPADLLLSLENGEEIHSEYETEFSIWNTLRLRTLPDCERVSWRLYMGGISHDDPLASERSLWYGEIDVVRLVKNIDDEEISDYFEIYWIPSLEGLAIGTNTMGGELHLPKCSGDWPAFKNLIKTSDALAGPRKGTFKLIHPWNCPRLIMNLPE